MNLYYLILLFSVCKMALLNSYELSIATLFRNEAPYLKEWVEYHKMVGVEHFYLFNNNSRDNWQEVLQPYIDQGIVEVIQWDQDDEKASHVGRQIHAFREAIAQSIGISKWIALIDVDEFILPMKEATVTECLEKHYQEASGVYVSWRVFGTGGTTLNPGDSLLLKLTSCSLRGHSQNVIGKSIVRPEDVSLNEIWYVHHFPAKPNKKYFNGDGEVLNAHGNNIALKDTCDKYIRINHYYLRDENYFKNVRMKRWEYESPEALARLLEHHREFSLMKDRTIIDFIKKKHPEEYLKIWKGGS